MAPKPITSLSATGSRVLRFAMPGVVFAVAFALSAAHSAAEDARRASVVAGAFAHTPTPPPPMHVGIEDLPLDVSSRLHGCQKISYTALGNFLKARGVNIASTTNNSAGQLYAQATTTLGIPTLDSRSREPSFLTTAGASKVFDIFVAAAPEIIANIGNPTLAPACTVTSMNSPMFDSSGACVENSVSCLIGRPATANDMILCNLALSEADPNVPADVTRKQEIAIATMLAAAHLCE
jgi:hypothetical protein